MIFMGFHGIELLGSFMEVLTLPFLFVLAPAASAILSVVNSPAPHSLQTERNNRCRHCPLGKE